jgi:hypothetical protein
MPGVSRLTHPFERRPHRHRRRALVAIAVLALLPTVLGSVVHPLHEDKPGGKSIIDFELAGSVSEADEILATWRAEDVIDDAKRIQLFDLVYPLIYASAIAGSCVAAAGAWRRAGRASLGALGIAMAWVAFAAAGFDYIENVGLGISLWNEPASPWPQISYVAALLKFTASTAALLYALSGLIARAMRPTAPA